MLHTVRGILIDALTWPPALAAYARAQWQWRTRHAHAPVQMAEGPNWGGNKNDPQGPPDLDEIFRKFNQKLGGLFGGKKGGTPNGGGGNGPSGAIGGAFALASGIAVSIWLFTGIYIVDQGSKGIELRLGKYSQTTDAGPGWNWPYPIGKVEVVNVEQVRSLEVGHRNSQKVKMKEEALMLTQDLNIADVQFAVQYVLKSAEEYKFNNRDPDEAVRQAAETAMREVVGRSSMDYVLYEGRGNIPGQVKLIMQTILDRYKSGILVSSVNLQNVQPPEQVQASFNDALRANQDKDRLKNEGEAYANDILPKARGTAARMIEEANGHKQRVVANAQGDASRFSQLVSEYEKAPGVTRERLYLDTMQQILQGTSKVVIDQKAGNNLLYLPLDKLIGARPAAPSADAARLPTPEPPTVITPDTRRDLRNR
ncbi:MAG: FtsH protease activity modulator HflK [Betaproteobacteria bacterium]|nr:FtsH protease activity modulator HflK [Betaproteobacteria bacterium]